MRTIFDESAKWYPNFYSDRDSASSADKILEILEPPNNATIFDLGCGTGEITNRVRERGYKTIGIDPSKKMIAAAELAFSEENCQWLVGDLNDVKENSIESGYAYFHVVNYIAFQDGINTFIKTLSKKMKPNSRFVFDYWRKDQVASKGLESRQKNFLINDVKHCREVTPEIISMDHIEIRIRVFPIAGQIGVNTTEIHELAVFDESQIVDEANRSDLSVRFTNWNSSKKDFIDWDSVCILEKSIYH